ncbi:MAG: hemolysin family protein [Bacteroidia bacterium]|nr:hemolysin family protein [Bacteroidia bacterium]
MELFLAILTLTLSFFFSGVEIAFLSANRLKIELRTVQGDRAGEILSNFKKRTSEVLITILIGNNVALVVFTIMMENLTEPGLKRYMGIDPENTYLVYTFIQATISTLIVLVLAEYIPKAIFRRNSDQLVFPSAYILRFFYLLLWIPVWTVNLISKFLLKVIFRHRTDDKIVELDKKDLEEYIQEIIATSESLPVPDLDTEMLTNALALKETKARECMIPRTEIVAASASTGFAELLDLFIETGLSKIIVYGENLDDIKGFVHSNGLFRKPEVINSIIQPVLVVPETMPANVLLAELTENKRSVAIVVDEFGGTAGMVTMEDLVEEVFGEIEDEHDDPENEEPEEDMVIIPEKEGGYILGARNEIYDLNEKLGLDLPEEEYYTTLGGLIMHIAERIPAQEEVIDIGMYNITILNATQNRIIAVKLQKRNFGE